MAGRIILGILLALAADDLRVLRRGAELIAVLHPDEADAPALKGVVISQPLQGFLRPGTVRIQSHADAADMYRLSGGEKDALRGNLHFLVIQWLSRPTL